MCGIVAYIGKRDVEDVLIKGLESLEYRGYDSAGLALANSETIVLRKVAGRVNGLRSKHTHIQEGILGIAHTRWATHGKPTLTNAHPHYDCAKNIYLAHNGIIENYAEIKKSLQARGHRFYSQTDTEILAHLIEEHYGEYVSLESAVARSLQKVKGTYGLVVIAKSDPGKIVAARMSSPLLIGMGEGEYFIASDASAVLPYTNKVIHLEDGEMAIVEESGVRFQTIKQEAITKSPQTIEWSLEQSKKEGFPNFMLKEIFEEPEALRNTLRGRVIEGKGEVVLGIETELGLRMAGVSRVIFCGCGTAYLAGLYGKYLAERLGIEARAEYASEFRYSYPVIGAQDLFVTISQSGETADTLAALRLAKSRGALTLGVVNVVGSTISRETDGGIFNHIGPEIGVASTKAFISQLGILNLLVLALKKLQGEKGKEYKTIARELIRIPKDIEEVLKNSAQIKKIARRYAKYKNFIYIGRGVQMPIAMEGALKLKEVSYIHAEGLGAGEMKHGPIAMIDKNFPTFALAVQGDETYEKMISNIQEIKAREGKVIVVAAKGDLRVKSIADDVIYIPRVASVLAPLLSVIPLQLFAYYSGIYNGLDVDKPRNLAKSVTVE